MSEDQTLAIHQQRAFVMNRSPFFIDDEGLLWLHEDAFTWIEVNYLEPGKCEHQYTLCPECQKSWYWDHNILLVCKSDNRIFTNFDVLADQYRREAGITDPPLDPNPWG